MTQQMANERTKLLHERDVRYGERAPGASVHNASSLHFPAQEETAPTTQRVRRRNRIIVGFLTGLVALMLLRLAVWGFLLSSSHGAPHHPEPSAPGSVVCNVSADPKGDSAAEIQRVFDACGHNSKGNRTKIVFGNTTYTIASVLNTTNLKHVDIELHGTLAWDNSDINYWLNNSLPMGYQNQSTAWLLGGEDITFKGFGYGTFNGNGQVWYDFVNGASNYPRRPHQLTITGTSNSLFEGINFLNSQMWTMTVIWSSHVLLQDIYVNNTSTDGTSAVNTDGADTIYADNIHFRRWTVDNGDDAISPKANSTNILIEDSTFYTGSGIAIGSIGQYNGAYEVIRNVTSRNITTYGTKYGVGYIKTWTGVVKGYPPNGGGGGIGYASDLYFHDFSIHNCQQIFAITQCTAFDGQTGQCDTSKFNIHDVYLSNVQGTDRSDVVATLQCSAASPCYNIEIENVNVENVSNNTTPRQYQCDSVEQAIGFNCTGPPDGENNGF